MNKIPVNWQKYVLNSYKGECFMKHKNFFRVLLCVFVICISGCTAFADWQYGSRGVDVRKLQEKLTELGYYEMKCDGVFGIATKDAVIEYQKDHGLKQDGIVGKKTLTKLRIVSEKDVKLLTMIINGEARGESLGGQIAVGAVVLNRVNHPAFPDTIEEVIYQKGAFSAVKDGQVNKKIISSSRKAAEIALGGYDPTGGAVYYYNPKTATCNWIKSRQVVKRIGNHLFCI